MDLWNRHPGETAKAFHAFTHYLVMPVSERSIDAAHAQHKRDCDGEQMRSKRGARRGASRWMQWSAANDWILRVAAHDSDLARRRRARMAAELERAQDDAVSMARVILGKVVQRLGTLKVEDLPIASLHHWFKTATDVELKALGHEERQAVRFTDEDGASVIPRVEVLFRKAPGAPPDGDTDGD